MQNHEKYEDIVVLFVKWNEKQINDSEFAEKVVDILGSDYNSASLIIEDEGEYDGAK